MAITTKPQSKSQKTSAPGVDIDALINRGGSVATTPLPSPGDEIQKSEEIQKVLLRVPTEILNDVDARVKAKKVKSSRHQWILEAIVARLEKESE